MGALYGGGGGTWACSLHERSQEEHSKHKGRPWKVPEIVRRPKGLLHRASLDEVSSLGKALQAKERSGTFFHNMIRNQ